MQQQEDEKHLNQLQQLKTTDFPLKISALSEKSEHTAKAENSDLELRASVRPKQLLPLQRSPQAPLFMCLSGLCLHVHDTYLEIISKISQNPFSYVCSNSHTQKCGVSLVKHHA